LNTYEIYATGRQAPNNQSLTP